MDVQFKETIKLKLLNDNQISPYSFQENELLLKCDTTTVKKSSILKHVYTRAINSNIYIYIYIYMGVYGFACFQNIYSYIATVPAVKQWYFHLCSATLGLYRIPCLK